MLKSAVQADSGSQILASLLPADFRLLEENLTQVELHMPKQLEAPVTELALQPRDEIERVGTQNLTAASGGRSFDLDLAGGGHYSANVQIQGLG